MLKNRRMEKSIITHINPKGVAIAILTDKIISLAYKIVLISQGFCVCMCVCVTSSEKPSLIILGRIAPPILIHYYTALLHFLHAISWSLKSPYLFVYCFTITPASAPPPLLSCNLSLLE